MPSLDHYSLSIDFLEMASSVADILNSGPVPLARVRDDARRTLVALLDAVRRFRRGREKKKKTKTQLFFILHSIGHQSQPFSSLPKNKKTKNSLRAARRS